MCSLHNPSSAVNNDNADIHQAPQQCQKPGLVREIYRPWELVQWPWSLAQYGHTVQYLLFDLLV